MPYLAIAICWTAAITGAVYLVMHGHPWFAALVLLIGCSAGYHDSDKDDKKGEDNASQNK